jgi:hypothetical protein
MGEDHYTDSEHGDRSRRRQRVVLLVRGKRNIRHIALTVTGGQCILIRRLAPISAVTSAARVQEGRRLDRCIWAPPVSSVLAHIAQVPNGFGNIRCSSAARRPIEILAGDDLVKLSTADTGDGRRRANAINSSRTHRRTGPSVRKTRGRALYRPKR